MSGRTQTERNFQIFMEGLRALGADLDESAQQVLQQIRDAGYAETVKTTPVKTGYLRKQWNRNPAVHKSGEKWMAGYENNVYYAGYVNDGHRIMNRKGKLIRWWDGLHMVERGMNEAERQSEPLFQAELKRVKEKTGF